MLLSRRALIKSGVTISAIASVGGKATAFSSPKLVIFDSRSLASITFARRYAAPRIDVAKEDEKFWRALRTASPEGRVVGMTGWSDFVIVRGLLEEKGKRLKGQMPTQRLFRWTME